jgi:hypothetical protein
MNLHGHENFCFRFQTSCHLSRLDVSPAPTPESSVKLMVLYYSITRSLTLRFSCFIPGCSYICDEDPDPELGP